MVATAAVAFALFVVPPQRTAGPPLRDFESYYAAGTTWRYHGEPYGREIWRTERTIPGVDAARDELLPFVGPPFGLPLWSALSRFAWPQASLVWALVMAASLLTLALCSLRLGGGRIQWLEGLAALAFCAGFGPLTSGLALGQVAIASCAAVALLPFLLGPRRTLAAAGCVLVAALQPNIAVVLAVRLQGRRAWIAFTFAALICLLGGMLALGEPAGLTHYLSVLRDHAAAERFSAIQTTPAAVARALGAGARWAGAIGLTLTLGTLALVARQTLSRRYAPDARLALACAALPLALPFAHEHDFAIVLIPAMMVARRARGIAWVLGAVAALAVGVDWLGLAQRPTSSAATAALTLAMACALPVLAAVPLRGFHFVPALVAPAALLAAAFAGTHPLPIWPDALPQDFHAAASLGAAQVWHEEQRRSGILTLWAGWGVLRLASLSGCALLWAVASVVLREPGAARQA